MESLAGRRVRKNIRASTRAEYLPPAEQLKVLWTRRETAGGCTVVRPEIRNTELARPVAGASWKPCLRRFIPFCGLKRDKRLARLKARSAPSAYNNSFSVRTRGWYIATEDRRKFSSRADDCQLVEKLRAVEFRFMSTRASRFVAEASNNSTNYWTNYLNNETS